MSALRTAALVRRDRRRLDARGSFDAQASLVAGLVAGLVAVVVTAVAAGATPPSAQAGPGIVRSAGPAVGALDPSFSPDAPSGITAPFPLDEFVDVAVQHDGKPVVVSDSVDDFFVARYNTDGSLDKTFGINGTGVVTVDVGGAAKADRASAVAVDAMDRIVVVGSGGSAVGDMALVRLSPDGKVADLSTHVHVGNSDTADTAEDVTFQSDGTIVVVGQAKVGGDRDVALIRLDATTGALLGAAVTTSFTSGDDAGHGVAVYPSGPDKDKIVIVGETGTPGNSAIAITQRLPDGSVDPTFVGPSAQKVIDASPSYDTARGVAITPSGSIVVAGLTKGAGFDLAVFELLPNGSFDGRFNLGSIRTFAIPGDDDVRNDPLALQPDGKIVVTGDIKDDGDVGVFRLNPDGSSDTSFGTAGTTVLDVKGNDDAGGVAFDPRGYLYVSGDDTDGSGFLARLVASPDSDGDGVRDVADSCPTVAGTLPDGCALPPEAVLKGKKVLLNTVLTKKSASAKCPAKAKVVVRTKTAKGKVSVTKHLKTKAAIGGCRVKGKVKLPAKPKKTAAVKVRVTGTRLVSKRLVAVRA